MSQNICMECKRYNESKEEVGKHWICDDCKYDLQMEKENSSSK